MVWGFGFECFGKLIIPHRNRWRKAHKKHTSSITAKMSPPQKCATWVLRVMIIGEVSRGEKMSPRESPQSRMSLSILQHTKIKDESAKMGERERTESRVSGVGCRAGVCERERARKSGRDRKTERETKGERERARERERERERERDERG